MQSHTWDGLPISPDPPFGAAIIVHRMANGGTREFLVLHRRAVPDDTDWAWGPPSGCRWPGEDIAVTARRELYEETGLDRHPSPVAGPDPTWPAFTVHVEPNTVISLSDEHDRLAWLPADEALIRVSPDVVRDQLWAVIAALAVV